MNNISFTSNAWEEYCYWQTQDKKTLTCYYQISGRNKYEGIGKPEPLKENLSGYWSRRIDEVNRLVYRINNEQIEVIQCKGYYE